MISDRTSSEKNQNVIFVDLNYVQQTHGNKFYAKWFICHLNENTTEVPPKRVGFKTER